MIYDIGTGLHDQTVVLRSIIPGFGVVDHCGDYLYELINAPNYLSITGSLL